MCISHYSETSLILSLINTPRSHENFAIITGSPYWRGSVKFHYGSILSDFFEKEIVVWLIKTEVNDILQMIWIKKIVSFNIVSQ